MENKNNTITIIIVILVAIASFAGGYVVNDIISKKDNTVIKETDKKEETTKEETKTITKDDISIEYKDVEKDVDEPSLATYTYATIKVNGKELATLEDHIGVSIDNINNRHEISKDDIIIINTDQTYIGIRYSTEEYFVYSLQHKIAFYDLEGNKIDTKTLVGMDFGGFEYSIEQFGEKLYRLENNEIYYYEVEYSGEECKGDFMWVETKLSFKDGKIISEKTGKTHAGKTQASC